MRVTGQVMTKFRRNTAEQGDAVQDLQPGVDTMNLFSSEDDEPVRKPQVRAWPATPASVPPMERRAPRPVAGRCSALLLSPFPVWGLHYMAGADSAAVGAQSSPARSGPCATRS